MEQFIPDSFWQAIPFWIRVSIVVVCYGTPGILLAPKKWRTWVWNRLKFTPPEIRWAHIAGAAMLVSFVQLGVIHKETISSTTHGITNWLDNFWTDDERRSSIDRLLTRPICESGDCDNFDFLVRECELQAVQVGGLAIPPRRRGEVVGRGDPVSATEYFRGCLVAQGLSWKPCERGEPDCRLLWPFSTRLRRSLPSFIAK